LIAALAFGDLWTGGLIVPQSGQGQSGSGASASGSSTPQAPNTGFGEYHRFSLPQLAIILGVSSIGLIFTGAYRCRYDSWPILNKKRLS
jgi:hypothetical protein